MLNYSKLIHRQYTLKNKKQEKNIILDKFENVRERIEQSLEELNYLETWTRKKAKYRFPIEKAQKAHLDSFSSRKDIKPYKTYCSFY